MKAIIKKIWLGSDVIMAVGSMVKTAVEVRHMLKEIGYACSLVNARFVKPIDEEQIREVIKEHKLIVTMEENVEKGGYGDSVRRYVDEITEGAVKVLQIAIPDVYVEHGNVDLLKKELGMDEGTIAKRIVTAYVGIERQ